MVMVAVLLVRAKDAFGPVLGTRHLRLDATRPLVQIIDDVVVVVGAVIVHVLVLQELWPAQGKQTTLANMFTT